MSGDPIRLRELPGVQHINELCLNPRNFEYPQISYTMEKVRDASRRLFCIDESDTRLTNPAEDWEDVDEDDDELLSDEETAALEVEFQAEMDRYAQHEAKFQVTNLPWIEARPFWEAIGWDISDGCGNELVCAYLFTRQIIAVAGGLIEGARFCPNGDGVGITDDWGDPLNSEQDLEKSLTRDAERFLMERGKKLS